MNWFPALSNLSKATCPFTPRGQAPAGAAVRATDVATATRASTVRWFMHPSKQAFGALPDYRNCYQRYAHRYQATLLAAFIASLRRRFLVRHP
jgi:hypothetical protein